MHQFLSSSRTSSVVAKCYMIPDSKSSYNARVTRSTLPLAMRRALAFSVCPPLQCLTGKVEKDEDKTRRKGPGWRARPVKLCI